MESLNKENNFKLNSLEDLEKFKVMMDRSNLKINKSQLAREFGVDRRTIDKYLNGYKRKNKKNTSSK